MDGAMGALRSHGVETFYGKWLVEGSPRVLLVDVESASAFFEEWQREFERGAEVSLPPCDAVAGDAVAFGYLTTWLLKEVSFHSDTTRRGRF